MGFRQFGPHILTLEKQANAVRAEEILRIAQELRQGRAGPGGDHIEDFGGNILHPLILNRNRQIHGLGGGGQESAFLGGGVVQGHPDPVPQQFRQHQPWEPGSGTQIRQGFPFFRNQRRQLGGIPEMPPPQVFQGLGRHQIVPDVPVTQKIGVSRQAFQCFT